MAGSLNNDDKIAQFQAVTGLQDSTLCADILQRFGWDLDLAIGSLADGEMEHEVLYSTSSHGAQAAAASSEMGSYLTRDNRVNNRDSQHLHRSAAESANGRQPIVQHQVQPGLLWRVATIPISVIRGSFYLVHGAFGLGMWIAGGIITHSLGALGFASQQRTGHQDNGSSPLLPMSHGALEALHFIRSFAHEYGDYHPAFQTLSFMDALKQSKDEFKFLLVYLHSADHENTPLFVQQTLCSESVVQFLNNNFVVWGGSIKASEGFRMSNILKASTFPFCAVVMASTNQRITLLQQFEGPRSSGDLVLGLQRVLDEHGIVLVDARMQEEERHLNRRLRDEQDAAYQAALRADQEREQKRKEEAERLALEAAEAERKRKEAEEAAAKAIQEAAEKEAAIERRRQEKAKALGHEPEKGPDVTEVLVRFPNGERQGRRFQSSSTISFIYDYVDSLPGFGAMRYKLVSNFPRVVFGDDKMQVTLKDAGLHPRASLYVQIEDE